MPVEIYNHQTAEPISSALLERLNRAGNQALPWAVKNGVSERGILSADLEVEISIVDDAKISEVHDHFMHIPGATDVITFSYADAALGEIVISAETARSHGAEYGYSLETELMLYIIHGLLHLAGHEDEDPAERETMERIQLQILKEVWAD